MPDSRNLVRPLLWITALAVVLAGTILAYLVPRRAVLDINDRWVGVYRGMGITNDDSIFGYRFIAFEIDDLPYSRMVVRNTGETFNPFTITYPNGTPMVTGTCKIEGVGLDAYPLIDEVDSATCYLLNGTVDTTVRDGTGTLTTYHPNGDPHWVSEYIDHNRLSIDRFDPVGGPPTASDESPPA